MQTNALEITDEIRNNLCTDLHDMLDNLIAVYSYDFLPSYYGLMSDLCRRGGNIKLAKLLRDVARCLDSHNQFREAQFNELYRKQLNDNGITVVSDVDAARQIFNLVDGLCAIRKKEILSTYNEYLTDSERYTLDNFFKIVLSPLNNPNIQLKEDGKCFYDRHPYDEFRKDLDFQIDQIKENVAYVFEVLG